MIYDFCPTWGKFHKKNLDLTLRLLSLLKAKSVVLEGVTKMLSLSFGLVYLGVGLINFCKQRLEFARKMCKQRTCVTSKII